MFSEGDYLPQSNGDVFYLTFELIHDDELISELKVMSKSEIYDFFDRYKKYFFKIFFKRWNILHIIEKGQLVVLGLKDEKAKGFY